MQKKKCMMCKKQKPLSEFNDFIKSKTNPDGKRTVCKPCQAKRDKNSRGFDPGI